MSKISRYDLEVILEPLWDQVHEHDKSPESEFGSILWIVIDAIEDNGWTYDEYFNGKV